MELRRLSLCLAFLLVAVISHCSEARHSLSRRETSNDYFQDDTGTDTEQNDAYTGSDTEQNDADGGDEEETADQNATILTRPESYTVQEGQTVQLDCKIDLSDSVVGWKKNDMNIVVNGFVFNDNSKYKLSGTNLIVQNLTEADSGVYQCSVAQLHPVQIEHRLMVLQSPDPKVQAITATDNARPKLGSNLTLTCHVTGIPRPAVVWSKQVNNENERLAEGATLTLYNVTANDTGMYLCYALGEKTADTKEIRVVVQGKPRMHVARTVVNAAIDVEALLQCSVHEEEPVSITWYKDNKLIAPSRYSNRGTHSNLTVIPRSDEDFGTYTCKAVCDIGTHHRSIDLVQWPIVEQLESDGPKLSWRVHSHLPLTNIEIQLIDPAEDSVTKLVVPVPEKPTHEYEMSYMVDSSVKPGNYHVVVKVDNEKGTSQSDNQMQYQHELVIQEARVLPGAGHASRPTTALLSTVLMYLLVRMI